MIAAFDVHVGTPDDVIASLRADSTLERVTDLVFQAHSIDPPHPHILRSIELIADVVAPALGWVKPAAVAYPPASRRWTCATPAFMQATWTLHRTRRSRAITSRRDFGLHFTDWVTLGAAAAPGSRRARPFPQLGSPGQALRTDFHVIAPDLRGHGDSGWATGSSYSLADHVYDLTGLVKSEDFEKVTLVGHSMGGMVGLTYAGAFPDKVSRLVVLDGVTNFPARRLKSAHIRIAEWTSDLDKFAQRKIHRYPSLVDGAERTGPATRGYRASRRCISPPTA